jgi:hypothetical protein
MLVCRECRAGWELDDAPLCNDSGHHHVQLEWHLHRSEVTLPGGGAVVAVSYDARDPYARDAPPDFGLYLDRNWRPPWPHAHVHWPDFGAPEDPDALATALRALLERARGGARVELGCYGGHGRTGTALACLAVLGGHPPESAVAWVRANYCAHAVETAEQEEFVTRFA